MEKKGRSAIGYSVWEVRPRTRRDAL